jgi:hypothetical protein
MGRTAGPGALIHPLRTNSWQRPSPCDMMHQGFVGGGMTAVRRDEPMTVEEFLKWDDGRYELVEGVPRLMAPHTDKHATMQSNLSRAIGNHLIARNAPCRVGPSRVWGYPIEQGIPGQIFHRRRIRNRAGYALGEERDRHASS